MEQKILVLSFDDEETKKMYNNEKINTENWEMNDSGFDLFFPNDIKVEPNKTTKVSLGVKCAVYNKNTYSEMILNNGALINSQPYFVFPRSSIGKTSLRLANSVGIIDAQYRGNLIVQIDNISSDSYMIKKGQRLFQICSRDLTPFYNVITVDKLQNTERGSNGIGSTGQ
jgi:dUTP pyrophosphatase